MPAYIEYSNAFSRRTYTSSWGLNSADAPKPEEFVKPENRPGWQVFDFPPRP